MSTQDEAMTVSPNGQQTDVSRSRFQSAYGEYWETVKDVVDEKGWAYNNELPHMIDGYFEMNTGKSIEYQKHYEGEWRGCRWRPKELSDCG